jgi:dimethylargininase
MISGHAITRAVGPAIGECALTFIERRAIDVGRAVKQHAEYCAALRRTGLTVQTLRAEEGLADAVFVEDTAVVLDEVAVLARPGAESRRGEVDSIAVALAARRPLARIEEPGTLDGGDVLRIGRTCYVGLSSRTNAEGAGQLAAIGGRFGYRTVNVEVTGCLHLKSAVAYLGGDTVLIREEWIDPTPFEPYRKLAVPDEEPFSADVLTLGDVIYVSASWPRTRAAIEQYGFRTHVLEISEFEKAEAGATCLSLVLW